MLSLRSVYFPIARLLEWTHALGAQLWISAGLMRRQNLDAIYVPTSELPYVTLPALLLSLLYRKPLVLVNLNIGPLTLKPSSTWVNCFLHNLARLCPRYRLLTISQSLANELSASRVSGPYFINGVGLDSTPFQLSSAPPPKIWDALFIGRHTALKGVLDLPAIWKQVMVHHPHARLALAGTCDPAMREQLVREIARLGLEAHILLLGPISEKEKVQLLYRSRLFVFPSYLEGWGIAPQEAMACSLPVVAYALPVYKENIDGCPSVFLVPLADRSAMARHLIHLLDQSPSQIERLGHPGIAWVKRFDWAVVARREFELISHKDGN
jgi:glycosyltransferase involved in cell wall biosynthesis